MARFLDAFIEFLFRAMPGLAKRMDIAIKSRLKYEYLYRDKPLPPERVYGSEEEVERHKRRAKRWHKNLDRYLALYDKARFPCDPPTEQVRRH